MIIIPEYVIEHYPLVHAWQSRTLTFAQQEDLAAGTLSQFDCGMWEYQKTCALAWMRSVLDDQGLTEAQAASRLAIDRGTLNRWRNGHVDPPFAQFQRFYACFGGRNKDDHPFQLREVLNLGGYLKALAYVKDWLGQHGESRAATSAASPPTLETFLCLYHFYANVTPDESLSLDDDIKFNKFLTNMLNKINQFVKSEFHGIRDATDILRVIAQWRLPWLICLTIIADAEGTDKKFRVWAKRPVEVAPIRTSR